MASHLACKRLKIVLVDCVDKGCGKSLLRKNMVDDLNNNASDFLIVPTNASKASRYANAPDNLCAEKKHESPNAAHSEIVSVQYDSDRLSNDSPHDKASSSVVQQKRSQKRPRNSDGSEERTQQNIDVELFVSTRDQRAMKRHKIKEEQGENESVASNSCDRVEPVPLDQIQNRNNSQTDADNEKRKTQSSTPLSTDNALTARDMRALRRVNIKAELTESIEATDQPSGSEIYANNVSKPPATKNGLRKHLKTEPIHLHAEVSENLPTHYLFSVGSLVFAKVRGYRAWPAKIITENKKRFTVRFYATHDTATLSQKSLYKYTVFTVNKFSLKSAKSKLSKLFETALKEIKSDAT